MTSEEPPRAEMSPKGETPPIKLFPSEELFRGEKIVCIDHEGAIYRLQITSRGKLILQK
ncbi:MAG: hemin uptake protein HemP [Planctomycetia bacterium]|nr:hemin uptake protein HemP [Planctomycetia bacterium]